MKTLQDIQLGEYVALVTEAGNSLEKVQNVTKKCIRIRNGLYQRDTGHPANKTSPGRLSVALKDISPLLQERENEAGQQLL